MKVAGSYPEAISMIRALQFDVPLSKIGALVGIDIGKQFGVRIITWMSPAWGIRLLEQLQQRDLPLPQVILVDPGVIPYPRVLIGADPE